jgi:ABC-type uncharacterized transport system substrate-binding protein
MFLSADLAQLTAVLARQRLPAIYAEKEYVHAGGLVSYGPDYPDLFRRAAAYTDKILKGMRPADLACGAADKIRIGDQPQDRIVPWTGCAANAARNS